MNIKKFAAFTAAVIITISFCSCNADNAAAKCRKLYSEGNYSEALSGLLEIDAEKFKNFNEGEYYHLIGNCYMQLEDYKTAVKYQEKCIRVEPEHFKAWVNMGIAYRKLGDRDKALSCYESALQYDTQNYAPFYISLGAVYIETGKPVSAVTYLEKAQKLNPDQSVVYAYLAIAYAMEIEPKKSEEAFQTASEMGYPYMEEIKARIDKIK